MVFNSEEYARRSTRPLFNLYNQMANRHKLDRGKFKHTQFLLDTPFGEQRGRLVLERGRFARPLLVTAEIDIIPELDQLSITLHDFKAGDTVVDALKFPVVPKFIGQLPENKCSRFVIKASRADESLSFTGIDIESGELVEAFSGPAAEQSYGKFSASNADLTYRTGAAVLRAARRSDPIEASRSNVA